MAIDNEDIAWLHSQLRTRNRHFRTESRNSINLRPKHDACARRTRARLATAAKEKTEVNCERDVLFCKLNGVKQLVVDPALDTGSDTHKTEPGPSTTAACVRPPQLPHRPRGCFVRAHRHLRATSHLPPLGFWRTVTLAQTVQ